VKAAADAAGVSWRVVKSAADAAAHAWLEAAGGRQP
jgi:hypothetical protein